MNQHVMTYLQNLRDEAVKPETSMKRMIEIFKEIAKYV